MKLGVELRVITTVKDNQPKKWKLEGNAAAEAAKQHSAQVYRKTIAFTDLGDQDPSTNLRDKQIYTLSEKNIYFCSEALSRILPYRIANCQPFTKA